MKKLLLSALLMFSSADSLTMVYASESTKYSDVMDDLSKDENFNAETYLNAEYEENVFKIIQIAESSDKELFIYTFNNLYNGVNYDATNINMCDDYLDDGRNLESRCHFYDIELVSTSYDGKFDKYVVKDYKVSNEGYRYYNIAMISVPYNDEVHNEEQIINGTTDKVGIGVSLGWCVYTMNGKIYYECKSYQTMSVDSYYTGEIRFKNGFEIGSLVGLFNEGRSHFYSFNCDEYVIKLIYDADLSFTLKTTTYSCGSYDLNHDDDYTYSYDKKEVTLKKDDVANYQGSGWFAKEYKWNRIMKSSDYIDTMENQGVKFDSSARTQILSSQWTFAFYESQIQEVYGESIYTKNSFAEEVTLLRLHFTDVNGDNYNLGVISNSINSDGVDDGVGSGLDLDFFEVNFKNIEELFLKLIAIVGLILLVVILVATLPIFSTIFKGILFVLKAILRALSWFISLPFKLFKKNKRKNE